MLNVPKKIPKKSYYYTINRHVYILFIFLITGDNMIIQKKIREINGCLYAPIPKHLAEYLDLNNNSLIDIEDRVSLLDDKPEICIRNGGEEFGDSTTTKE